MRRPERVNGMADLGGSLEAAGKVGYGRRGRPTKSPKTLVYQLRMSEEDANLLDLVSYATDDSKAEVIRKALKMYASVKKSAY